MKVFCLATLALLLSLPAVAANGGPRAEAGGPKRLLVKLAGRSATDGRARPKRAAFTVELTKDGATVQGYETSRREDVFVRVAKTERKTVAITTAFGLFANVVVDHTEDVVRVQIRYDQEDVGDSMSLSSTGAFKAFVNRGDQRHEVKTRPPVDLGMPSSVPFAADTVTTTLVGRPNF